MTNTFAQNPLKYIFIDLLLDILYWPVWWYSRGLIKIGRSLLNEILDQQERLGVNVWLKNLFTPMFGQYDLEGRLISFFMRLVQIIFRSLFLLIWAAFIFALFLFWLILPILIIYEIIINFFWLFS